MVDGEPKGHNILFFVFVDLADGIGYDSRGDPNCTIHSLCDLYDGISVEAKTIKEFWLKPKIRNMIDQNVSKALVYAVQPCQACDLVEYRTDQYYCIVPCLDAEGRFRKPERTD